MSLVPRFLILWGINVVALWLCDVLFDGFDISGGSSRSWRCP